MSRDRVFSGIQPSGTLTIGNYLGALRNFKEQQEEYDAIYCVVDLHALTTNDDPEKLRKNSLEVLALYLASGLDPEKSTIFFQSHVSAHTELMWVLNTMTTLGHLERMTQYKSKIEGSEHIYAGLLNYPTLMAADILLYDAKYVPVGDDQRQHIEFTRDLAQRFNHRYGETFIIPEMVKTQVGSRIMSLQDPASKMSKSDENINGFISMLDEPKVIEKKIMRSVTDSHNKISYNEDQLGIKNLIDIHASFSGQSVESIVKEFEDQGYGALKRSVAEVVIEGLKPIQNEFSRLIEDTDYLETIYKAGAKKANDIAGKKLAEVYEKIGLQRK